MVKLGSAEEFVWAQKTGPNVWKEKNTLLVTRKFDHAEKFDHVGKQQSSSCAGVHFINFCA